AVRRLASLGRAAREEAGIRVRQPLGRMRVVVPGPVQGARFDSLMALLAAETNVKAIEPVESDEGLVRLKGKANFRSLGRKFGGEVQQVAKAISGLDSDRLRELESGRPIETPFRLDPEDVTVIREVVTDWPVASEGPFVVALDPAIDEELASEGLARELVNRIQRLRKDAGYEVSTRIALSIDGDAQLVAAAGRHRDYIAGETLAREFEVGGRLDSPDRTESITIDNHDAALAVRHHRVARTGSGPAQADAP
ncbi:MAG TPA: DUF5915 domain-containing protein, partial [Gemmatimonadales bacterium]|nr:DUF5915 domain-containing protein [Gemmatimonadales bacterium]